MKRVAVVTGGAQGIGLAIARRLSDEGYAIALWDLNEERLAEATEGLRAGGVDVVGAPIDVTHDESVKDGLDRLRTCWGRLDVLVNNAGVISHTSLFDLEAREWQGTLDVNLTGAFRCVQAAAPIMKAQNYGRIVNIASMAVRTGGESSGTAYASAKAGVVGLTKSLSRQLGPYGITANAVAPGIIDTAMISSMEPTRREAWERAIPLRRLGTAADVAAAVWFLVGADSTYITGVTLDINGGYYSA